MSYNISNREKDHFMSYYIILCTCNLYVYVSTEIENMYM